MIKLVVFDAYGVILSDGYVDTAKSLGKRFKRDWKPIFNTLETKYLMRAIERKISQVEAWKLAVKELELPMQWQDVRALHYSLMKLNVRMLTFADRVRKESRTIILTENTRSQLSDVAKLLGLKKHFTRLFNAREFGMSKASVAVWGLICSKFNVTPAEIIYIDDREIYLRTPKKLGVHTILYRNYTQCRKEFEKIS